MYLQKTKISFAFASVLLILTMLPCFNCNGDKIYGIDKNNNVFKLYLSGKSNQSWNHLFDRKQHKAKWESIGGRLTDISASGRGWVWGVNKKGAVFKCKKPCEGDWKDEDGKLSHTSGGQKFIWGIKQKRQVIGFTGYVYIVKGGSIYKRNVDGSGKWIGVPGDLLHVSANNKNWVWGTNKAGKVFKCKKPCSGKWIHVNGFAKQISAGQTEVYALNGDRNTKNKFYQKINSKVFAIKADGSGKWRQISGGLVWIDASSPKYVIGVNKDGKVFKCEKPCKGGWVVLPGRMKKASAVNYKTDAQALQDNEIGNDDDFVAQRLAEYEMDNLLVYQTPTKPEGTFPDLSDMDGNDLEDYTIIATLIVVGVLLWAIQMRSVKRQGKREEEEVVEKRIDLTEPMLVDVAQK